MTEPVRELADDRLRLPALPVESSAGPTNALQRWMSHGHGQQGHQAKPWTKLLWLTGVDYFSTLGYQPGIALVAAGALSPLATLILVVVTLFGALPVYSAVAKQSFNGQGSISMLERLLHGWRGKLFVLTLLGFTATDFVITMTLSAADAAQHVIENPYLEPIFGEAKMGITLFLLATLTVVFLKGFAEAIGVALAVGVPYILLNCVVVARGVVEIVHRPEVLSAWTTDISLHGDTVGLVLASILIFPKLALGLSGFETGVSVMPLVKGDPPDPAHADVPHGRIRATRKLLATAAVIMSVMLMATSTVTTLLIPKLAYQSGGDANGRAMAWLAHLYLGDIFGTVYDLSTILILWFAGASAMAGMLNLIPRYLPRFGMAPRWVSFVRPLVLVLFVIDVIVTVIFKADVEAQGGAYATGVLALILSASVAVSLHSWREARKLKRVPLGGLFFWFISAVFGFTFIDNVIERPDGVIISSVFIVGLLVLSAISRYRRATEFRVESMAFFDDESATLWRELVGKKVNLVPVKKYGDERRAIKAREIRQYYQVTGPLAFLRVRLSGDTSEFGSVLKVRVRRSGEDFAIDIDGAVAVANTIAYTSELLDPISIFLGLTRKNPMVQALRYLLWGEGETGILVYNILIKYWAWTPETDVRPLIFLMSE